MSKATTKFKWTNDKGMLAFHFSNQAEKELKFPRLTSYAKLNDSQKVDNGQLHFFAHENFPTLKMRGGDFISNVGIFIYKGEFNEKALELFYKDLTSGAELKDLLQETRGHFGLILFHKNKLHFITDKAGILPLYAYQKDGVVEVGSFLNSLAGNNALSLDYAGLMNHFVRGGDTFLMRSCFKEVTILNEGTIYTYEKGELKSERYHNLFADMTFNRYKSFDEVVEAARDLFKENLAFLKNQKDIIADLSGGFDTRTIMSFLINGEYDVSIGSCVVKGIFHPQIGSGLYEEADEDIRIASKIAEEFGLKRSVKYLDREQDFTLDEAYQFVRDMNPLCAIARARTYANVLGYHQAKGQKGQVSIAGLGGTETLNKRGVPKSHTEREFKAQKYYGYFDVLKDELLNKDEFYQTLQADFDQHLEGVDFEHAYDLEMFNSLHKKYKRGGLSLAHFNYFVPTYTPYLEANFIRFLSECRFNHKLGLRIQRNILPRENAKLSNMESTHGYPPTRIHLGNFYKFPKFFKEHPDQLPVFGALIKRANWKGAVKMRDSFLDSDWVNYAEKEFNKDLAIFKIFDKAKLEKHLNETLLPYEAKNFKAQLVALNQFFEEAQVTY